MKAWITKYALTDGVVEREIENCGGGVVKVIDENHWYCVDGKGRDWHLTREDAIARAEKMRKNKIASLRRHVELLEKLTFE